MKETLVANGKNYSFGRAEYLQFVILVQFYKKKSPYSSNAPYQLGQLIIESSRLAVAAFWTIK